MNSRGELDRKLDHLAGMLPVWLERLRHPQEFWPQFEALAGEILDHSSARDLPHVQRRLCRMLRAHHPRRVHDA